MIAIPCHWNKKVIEIIIKQKKLSKSIEIKEIYGVIPKEIVPHGRSDEAVIDIKRDKALNFRQYIKSKGFKFIYLLNAPFTFNSQRTKKKTKDYLDWIINVFKADALMVASYELMKFIRKHYRDVKIYISTIAAIANIKQLEKFLDINPTRVVAHHDVNRNFHDLKKLIKKANRWNIELELMLTESCLRRCPLRKQHYEYLGNRISDASFHTTCNSYRLTYPLEILKANFIRPEDISLYESMGVHHFKITGRSKPGSWLPEVTKAYLQRKYNGNIIRLLGIDPSINAENWIYLDNQALEGFLQNFPKTNNVEEENIYCNKWIVRLYNNKKFYIKDHSQYRRDKKGLLKCWNPGVYLLKIFKNEKINTN